MLATALMCLALNVYHESRGEPIRGQEAVAMVTLNRADDYYGRWPGDVCGVVFQRSQFSWTNDMVYNVRWDGDRVTSFKLNHEGRPHDDYAWQRSVQIAQLAMNYQIADPSRGALWFHTWQIREPSRHKVMVASIGNHRFFR